MPFDERIKLLAKGRFKPSRASFPFLGVDDAPIGVRLLSDVECDSCRFEAMAWVTGQAKARRQVAREMLDLDASILDREMERRIIHRAFLDPDTLDDDKPQPYFKSTAEIAELDAFTVSTLSELYAEHQNAMNPLRGLSEAEAEGLMDALGKAFADPQGPNIDLVLATYDAPTLRRLLLISVAQHAKSMPGT